MTDGFITSIIDPSDLISFDPEKEIAEHRPSSSKLFAFEGDDYIGFVQNKYMRWYSAILRRAYERGPIPKPFDRHHPWPRSIPGGTKEFGFVTIKLTPRKHFDTHWLLTKFTEGDDLYKMQATLGIMCGKNGKKLKPCQVAAAMKAARERKVSDVTRKKISDANRGRTYGPFSTDRLACHRGWKHSPEQNAAKGARLRGKPLSAKHRATLRGKKRTPEWCAAQSARLRGKTLSLEHREALSIGHRCKPWSLSMTFGRRLGPGSMQRVMNIAETVAC